MEWYSCYVLSWRLSNTLDAGSCIEALEEALRKGRPDICSTISESVWTVKEATMITCSLIGCGGQ